LGAWTSASRAEEAVELAGSLVGARSETKTGLPGSRTPIERVYSASL
jgi:hypothetical protein